MQWSRPFPDTAAEVLVEVRLPQMLFASLCPSHLFSYIESGTENARVATLGYRDGSGSRYLE